MGNIKINKPRLSGKTYDLIQKAINTTINKSSNQTVILKNNE